MNRERYSRRELLAHLGQGALGSLILACTGGKERIPLAIYEFRRSEGTWTREEIEALADSMLAEDVFTEIPYAGYLLKEGINGKPNFSANDSLFIDSLPTFISQTHLPAPFTNTKIPMGAYIAAVGPDVTLSNVPNEFQGKTSKPNAELQQIIISTDQTKDNSDFALKFIVAKEVMNYYAYNMVANYIAYDLLSLKLPSDPIERRAAMIYYVHSLSIDTRHGLVPVFSLADFWALYLMIPDYIKARQRNKFTVDDLKAGEGLGLFDETAKGFISDGILIFKNGAYHWTEDSKKFYDEWLDVSAYKYALVTGTLPPQNTP